MAYCGITLSKVKAMLMVFFDTYVPSYTFSQITDYLNLMNDIVMIPQFPYSPDTPPINYFLFPRVTPPLAKQNTPRLDPKRRPCSLFTYP